MKQDEPPSYECFLKGIEATPNELKRQAKKLAKQAMDAAIWQHKMLLLELEDQFDQPKNELKKFQIQQGES